VGVLGVAKKSKSARNSQAEKSGLKRLRKKGLYTPKKPRAAPTRYGRGLLKTFADVITGKASVVTVKPAKQKGRKRTKGFAEARKFASGEKPGTVRAKRNKLVVPTQGGERAHYNPRTGKVRVTRRVGSDLYVREPLKGKIRTLDDLRARLRPNDRIAIPFNRGGRGVEWMNMTPDEFHAFMGQYAQTYKNVLNFVEIFRLEGKSAELEPSAEPKPKRKSAKKSKHKTKLV
jgi:hypothetical protein